MKQMERDFDRAVKQLGKKEESIDLGTKYSEGL